MELSPNIQEDTNMKRGFLKRSLQGATFLTAIASMLLVIGLVEVEAAPKPLTCSISPADGTTEVGVLIRFSGYSYR